MRYALLVLLVAAAGLVVRLSHKTDNLEERIRILQERAHMPYSGYWVPTYTTTTLAGDPVTIGEASADTRQLLLFFNTTCLYCLASLPAWMELTAVSDTASHMKIHVVGISLDSADVTAAYVDQHALRFDVIRFPHRKLVQLYRAGTVPRLIVLDEEGRVLYSRTGALEGRSAVDSVIAVITAQ
jgi:peroxiredoxin